MKIVVAGRGNVGGALARLWQGAGHEVVSLGRDYWSWCFLDEVALIVDAWRGA